MNLSIGSQTKTEKSFELVVIVRDNKGNPTGRRKSFTCDTPQELEELWIKNNGVTKKRKRHKVEAATKEEAEKVIKKKGLEE